MAVGILAWLLASRIDPETTCVVFAVPIPLWVWWETRRVAFDILVDGGERVVLLVVVLVFAIGIGKALWSQAPAGELMGGTIARTLEPDNRSDPRLPYASVQLVAHGTAPYSSVGASYYAPWSFSDRGPIAGLASAPIVLGGGTNPPASVPALYPWEPYDAQGYAAYRIVLMLLGTTVLLSCYGALRRVLDETTAVAGVLILAMTPFLVHETYFVWPKLLSASFGVAALVALFGRRPWIAGLLLGLSYLAHPAGLLIIPGVVLTWLVLLWRGAPATCPEARRAYPLDRWQTRWIADVAWAAAGVFVIFVAWRIANEPHVYDRFSYYLYEANDRRAVSFGTWLQFRLQTLADTLLPFRLYAADAGSRWLNFQHGTSRTGGLHIIYGTSPAIVRFSFSYFGSLPFGVGLLYYPAYLVGIAVFARRAALLFLAAIVLPFLGFIIFWGFSITPLREGLQFVFVISVMAAFLGHSVLPPKRNRLLRAKWWPRTIQVMATGRAIELVIMLIVPTLLTAGLLGSSLFRATDVVALLVMVGGVLGLARLSWRYLDPGSRTQRPPILSGGTTGIHRQLPRETEVPNPADALRRS